MNESTRIDVNYLSLARGQWALLAGSDKVINIAAPGSFNDLATIDGSKYASILKLSSEQTDFKMSGLIITQGTENCVDINNDAKMDIEGVFGHPTFQGDQLFSVKAGASAKISGTIRGSGKRLKADVILDNWSDQNQDGSYLDITRLKHESGRKINVVKHLGKGTLKIGSNARVLWLNSLYLTVYNLTKKLIRKIIGIPNGKKGPSWF
jgi:hypothetical protein